jgi:hypothetical protein
MKFEPVSPERLVAESVEAEDLLPLLHHLPRVLVNLTVEPLFSLAAAPIIGTLGAAPHGGIAERDGNACQQHDDLDYSRRIFHVINPVTDSF